MHALRVLEFGRVCARLQFHCETPLAESYAEDLKPSWDPAEYWTLIEETRQAYEALGRYTIPSLGRVIDLRRPLEIASKGGTLNGAELFAIGEAMSAIRSVGAFLRPKTEEFPLLAVRAEALPENRRIEEQLLDSLEGDGTVRDAASSTLQSLRQRKKTAASRITERIQSYISGKSREYLSDPIYTVRDGRYVLPVKSEHRGKIRGIVHDTSSSGQTAFIEPEDVLQLGNQLREIQGQERAEEQRILSELSTRVGAVGVEWIGGIEAASALDLIFARARLGFEIKGVVPVRKNGHRIVIQGGKHPLLDPESTVPLDFVCGQGDNVLITGPNTGGKTVAIKTVGLFVAMAQCGMMLPALHVEYGGFTQIWADIGDEQSLQQSLSTFGGHIKNISEALNSLKPGALVLLDEVGAGTDPAEGAALAKAILLRMVERGATILASTHYGELKAFAYNTEGFSNAAMEFDLKSLRPTYRLLLGAPGASQALRIAERYGIPKSVLEQAKEGLSTQHQDISLMMERLDLAQKQARTAQSEADRRSTELKKAEERASRKLAEADEVRRTVHTRANEVIEAALREIRIEAERLFEEIKKAPHDPKTAERVRKGLRELQAVGRDFADEFVPRARPVPGGPRLKVERGMTVRIEGYTQVGVVIDDPRGDSVQVQVGPIKMTVPVAKLSAAVKSQEIIKAKPNVRLQKALSANTEIHLRNMRAEDAERDLEKFIDDAVLAGLPSIRIVHGKGEGILRKITHDYLRRHPHVSNYRDGEPAEGGHGVTIAQFK